MNSLYIWISLLLVCGDDTWMNSRWDETPNDQPLRGAISRLFLVDTTLTNKACKEGDILRWGSYQGKPWGP